MSLSICTELICACVCMSHCVTELCSTQHFLSSLFRSVFTPYKALSNLISTMCRLTDSNTLLLLSYEERTTGNKPEIERRFMKVSTGSNFMHIFIFSPTASKGILYC